MGHIDDTNARILEIGEEVGRIDEYHKCVESTYGEWDGFPWFTADDDGYGDFERLCLLFMEYEELTRPKAWRVRLEDNLYSVNPLIRRFSSCPPTTTTNG